MPKAGRQKRLSRCAIVSSQLRHAEIPTNQPIACPRNQTHRAFAPRRDLADARLLPPQQECLLCLSCEKPGSACGREIRRREFQLRIRLRPQSITRGRNFRWPAQQREPEKRQRCRDERPRHCGHHPALQSETRLHLPWPQKAAKCGGARSILQTRRLRDPLLWQSTQLLPPAVRLCRQERNQTNREINPRLGAAPAREYPRSAASLRNGQEFCWDVRSWSLVFRSLTISHSWAGKVYLSLKKSAVIRAHVRTRRTELNLSKSGPPGTNAFRGICAQRRIRRQNRIRRDIAGMRWQLPRKLPRRVEAPYWPRRRTADEHRIMSTP